MDDGFAGLGIGSDLLDICDFSDFFLEFSGDEVLNPSRRHAREVGRDDRLTNDDGGVFPFGVIEKRVYSKYDDRDLE